MPRCTRFHLDGTACTNTTTHVDNWCRQDDCPGFTRPDPSSAPVTFGAPRGTDTHIHNTAEMTTDMDLDDVPMVHVSIRAADSFRFHHGGDQRSAEVQLRNMLEDFLLKSARKLSATGYLSLARQGYEVVLSPDRSSITAYSTVHRERTWEQVKSGVPSRVRRFHSPRQPAVPREMGPPVPLDRFAVVFDASEVHLTARVIRSYAKLCGLPAPVDDDLDTAIRACAAKLPAGIITQRDDGMFEVEQAERIWLINPDCRTLIGVKSARPTDVDGAGAEVPGLRPPAAI
ncbi:hypothetical protein [Rhodococcus zopfii]|uniref:hypothetical protein n=1 Tax=Rhodococcus zopfii TaxID=43772 RepID=UPI000932139A|nr:hypothetical protein [Rhodococcus zopfii]